MIRDASLAGADIIKFQSYRPENFRKDDPEYEWLKKVSLSDETHYILKEEVEKYGKIFISSPFSLERAQFLCEGLGLKKIKIASGMMMNFKVLDYLNSANIITIFVSTGMATLKEINQALNHIKRIPDIYLMHCVTQYPCKDEEANLRVISTLQKEFNLPIGYSDHTIGIDACVAAVALGASVIEKHFTFDKSCPEGTDHILSATPDEFKEMSQKIRRLEVLLGNGVKELSSGEREILKFVRNRFSK